MQCFCSKEWQLRPESCPNMQSVVTQEWELAENTKKPHYHNKSESESEWKRVRLEFSAVKYLWQ